MIPIVLIHGYSAESDKSTPAAIAGIYGTLPAALRDLYGRNAVVEIDLSRYISLDDGLSIDDISRALDRALQQDFPELLNRRFNVIVHSTGALVIRNWLRRFSPKPSPVKSLIYLAGANLGSGWAQLGKGQIAQWGRYLFQGGAEAGVRVLNALELGSDWTLDLHLHFLSQGNTMAKDYEVYEYVIIGTQADVKWFEFPIRYGKEDGSDGVVRTSASNLNFNYVTLGPTARTSQIRWSEAKGILEAFRDRNVLPMDPQYEVKAFSRPGVNNRPEVPFAVPFECAHSGDDMGIVTGSKPRAQVLDLISRALETPSASWPKMIDAFQEVTLATYLHAITAQAPPWWKKWLDEPRAQYDPHAQLIFRVRDQDGRPVENFDIFFKSVDGRDDPSLAINRLFEDRHVNQVSPNIITFYIRTDPFDANTNNWVHAVLLVNGCTLEISAVEPETHQILYLPIRLKITPEQLTLWIQGHRTTIVDVVLFRLPSDEVFRIVPLA